MWGLSSLTRGQTCTPPALEGKVLTTGPPGKTPALRFLTSLSQGTNSKWQCPHPHTEHNTTSRLQAPKQGSDGPEEKGGRGDILETP